MWRSNTNQSSPRIRSRLTQSNTILNGTRWNTGSPKHSIHSRTAKPDLFLVLAACSQKKEEETPGWRQRLREERTPLRRLLY